MCYSKIPINSKRVCKSFQSTKQKISPSIETLPFCSLQNLQNVIVVHCRICQLNDFSLSLYPKLFSKLAEIPPMQPSINTGLPKHPNLTLMTSVKSSNVKGNLKKATCWGRLKRWTWMGTATSHTLNWKRLWRLWVAQGKCKECSLAFIFSPKISN